MINGSILAALILARKLALPHYGFMVTESCLITFTKILPYPIILAPIFAEAQTHSQRSWVPAWERGAVLPVWDHACIENVIFPKIIIGFPGNRKSGNIFTTNLPISRFFKTFVIMYDDGLTLQLSWSLIWRDVLDFGSHAWFVSPITMCVTITIDNRSKT